MIGERYFICIDAGTTRFKAACITHDGSIIKKKDYCYQNNQKVFHEYTKEDFKKALRETLDAVLEDIDSKRISAIGITGHGPTLIPVDIDGKVLSPAVGYLDERVKRYIKDLAKKESDHISSTMYLPIVKFFEKKLSSVYDKTYKFLQSFDYIAFLLTGEYTASSSSSGIKPWDKTQVEKSGLDAKKFPDIYYMGDKIGKVSKNAADEYGIPRSAQVYAIGVDFAAALVGAGTIHRGRACERAGTSGGINLCWDARIHDNRLFCYEHFIPDLWNIAGITSSSGKSLDWIARVLGIDELSSFNPRSTEKRLIFLPYLKGERTPLWNPYAKGVFFGLEETHDRVDLLQSVFLGVALSIRDLIDIIESNKCSFDFPVVTTGGQARSEWFIQLKSNVTGKRFSTTQTYDAELLGIAIVLSCETGHYPDLFTAWKKIVKISRVFEPEKDKQGFYSDLFGLYRELRMSLSKYFNAS
jgi:xylulokinase